MLRGAGRCDVTLPIDDSDDEDSDHMVPSSRAYKIRNGSVQAALERWMDETNL